VKRYLSIALGLLYLAALVVSLAMLVKPGSAVFHWRTTIPAGEWTNEGRVYVWPLEINDRVFDPDSLRVLEDGRTLEAATPDYVRAAGDGIFALEDGSRVLFAPTGGQDPASGGHTYTAILRPRLVTSNNGGRLLIALLAAGAAALALGPWEFSRRVRAWLNAPALEGQAAPGAQLRAALANTALAAFFYVFMEWVFFITRPSFMDMLTLGGKVRVLLVSGLAAALVAVPAVLILALAERLLSPRLPGVRRYALHLPAAAVLACLGLVLLDNFTYTLFRFGVVTAQGPLRAVYALVFAGLFVAFARWLAAPAPQRAERWRAGAALGLGTLSLALGLLSFQPAGQETAQAGQQAGRRPNIILISTDGLNASHMSAYGYERDTTPNIRRLMDESLAAMNNFSNASSSTGSDIAILTGKLPFQTRVLYPPDTLRGSDMYQHLPGILKRAGYRTVSLGVQYFVDANYVNMQNAFDAVNCQVNPHNDAAEWLTRLGYADEVFLAENIYDRISQRLFHIFYLRDMENPYLQVTAPLSASIDDARRMSCLLEDLDIAQETGQPLFAHVHMMGTHGPEFYPSRQVFSAGQEQTASWMTDFYDDVILDFDTMIGRLVDYLRQEGQLDETLLILYTDHGQRYTTHDRLPLIFRFPAGEYTGEIHENTQNLDIGPTVLDYLGIPQPEWMGGDSLLRPVDPDRLILGGLTIKQELVDEEWVVPVEKRQPPFYQFSHMSVLQCQNYYLLELDTLELEEGQIAGHTAPCPEESLASREEVLSRAAEQLNAWGFPVVVP